MRIVLFSLILFMSTTLVAQNNRVGINEIQLTTKRGDQPAFEFFIPDSDGQTVLNAWNKFHKPFKAKSRQDKDLRNYHFTDDATIEELSENTIDIYSRIYETSGGVRFACAFDLGGVFISSRKTPDKFQQAKLLLNKFYAQIAMDAIVAEIEMELQELAAIKDEYDAINEEIASFEARAKTHTEMIGEAEEEEVRIQNKLDLKSSELADHKTEFNSLQSELSKINKAGILADLTTFNNNLKKVGLETTRIEKDIDRKQAEIASLEAEIDILQNEYKEKTAYGAELREKVTDIENLLMELNIDEKEENARLLEQNIEAIETEQRDLKLKKTNYDRTISQEEAKLEKAQKAIEVSRETRAILQEKIEEKERKLRELEELKATIE